MEMRPENWHNLEAAEAITSLQSSNHGLSQEEAQKRLALYSAVQKHPDYHPPYCCSAIGCSG